jgi:hypothetical protein
MGQSYPTESNNKRYFEQSAKEEKRIGSISRSKATRDSSGQIRLTIMSLKTIYAKMQG